MNHRILRTQALLIILIGGGWGCAEEKLTTIDPAVDAGVGGGGADAGQPGDGSSDASSPRAGGDAGAGGSAGTPAEPDGPDAAVAGGCTGCVRLSGSGGYGDYQLQLATTWNLTRTVITWRVRVRNFTGDVSVVPYVQSGEGFEDEARLPIQALSAAADWQELALDLRVLDGGVAAAGVEQGATYDGTRVLRVGIAFQLPEAPSAEEAWIELDAVTLLDIPGLSSTFASDQGGFRLVDSPGVSALLVPE